MCMVRFFFFFERGGRVANRAGLPNFKSLLILHVTLLCYKLCKVDLCVHHDLIAVLTSQSAKGRRLPGAGHMEARACGRGITLGNVILMGTLANIRGATARDVVCVCVPCPF